ncbi:MAG: META domain-containing protein [Microthrixaceae bacterium]
MTNNEHLSELLERTAERVNVGPPPVDAMIGAAARVRRRARVGTVIVMSLLLIVLGGVAFAIRDMPSAPIAGEDRSVTDLTDSQVEISAMEGTWDVVALVGESGKSVMPPELHGKVSLTFDDGALVGDTGCNLIRGTYGTEPNDGEGLRLTLELSSITRAACAVEAPLVERLGTVRYTTVSDGHRYLHAENWMIVAQLRRQ